MIGQALDAFIRDCKSRDLSHHTIDYYSRQIKVFQEFCSLQGVTEVTKVTADLVRFYLISLQEKHNEGGRDAKYRALKVFLLWYEKEMEPEGWKNPIRKVARPKVPKEVIKGVDIEDIQKLVNTCGNSFEGIRDRAAMLFLFDTGVRISEFLALTVYDVDIRERSVFIRHGKGDKPRTVYFGKKTYRDLRKYLRLRHDNSQSLWVTRQGDTLAVKSMQGMLGRRAEMAGIPTPSPHDFRRAFALHMLRAGVDVFTLKLLMGHATLDVLSRYLAQVESDAKLGHEVGSPVDKLLGAREYLPRFRNNRDVSRSLGSPVDHLIG